MKIIDRTRIALGAQNPLQTRNVSQITHIAVHHSATESGNSQAFENFWQRTHGWRNGGYMYIILRNGDVEHNYPATVVTNGVAGHNHYIINVCVVGSGQFTYQQEESLEKLLKQLMAQYHIPVSNVLGHNEFQGARTECPGRNMNALRKRLTVPASNVPNPSVPNTSTHTVRQGDTLFSIARTHHTTVQALKQLNNLTSNLIHPNLTLTLPSTQFQPGQKVRIAPTATNWSTGEPIPNWTRSHTFTIRQIANHQALLDEVTSWIALTDLT